MEGFGLEQVGGKRKAGKKEKKSVRRCTNVGFVRLSSANLRLSVVT